MKLILTFLMSFCVMTGTALSQSADPSMLQHTKQLIQSVEDKMRQQNPKIPESIAESTELLQKIPEFGDLEKDAKSTWQFGLDNISLIAPTDVKKPSI